MLELVMTAALLAIIAAIAIPSFMSLQDKARQSTDIASATEIANAINLHNHASPEEALSQGDVSGWASEADVQAALEGLTPKLEPDNFAQAIDRVNVNEYGIATVNTAIN